MPGVPRKAGSPCTYPWGDPTPRPHKTRGSGQHDKHLQERIDRQTARQRASYGPLFQDLADAEVTVPTVAEVKLAERYGHARDAERSSVFDTAMNGLEWIRLQHIRRELAGIIGEFWAEALWEYATRVFRSNEGNVSGFLSNCLCTDKPQTLRYELRFDPARVKVSTWTNPATGKTTETRHDGRYLHDTLVWPPLVLASVPVMTRAEWDARFPRVDREPEPTRFADHDDGGLFERTVAVVTGL